MTEWKYKTITFDYIHEEIKAEAERIFPMPHLGEYSYDRMEHEKRRQDTIERKKYFIQHEPPKRIKKEIERLISLDDYYPDEPDIRGYEFDSEKDGKYTFKKKLTE